MPASQPSLARSACVEKVGSEISEKSKKRISSSCGGQWISIDKLGDQVQFYPQIPVSFEGRGGGLLPDYTIRQIQKKLVFSDGKQNLLA